MSSMGALPTTTPRPEPASAGDAMSPGELSGAAWRFTTAPWRLGLGVTRSAIDTGERATRALALSGERALLQLLDTVMSALIGEKVLDRVLVRVEEAGVVQHVAQHALESGVVEQIAERLLTGPELRRMLRSGFRSELPDELATQ